MSDKRNALIAKMLEAFREAGYPPLMTHTDAAKIAVLMIEAAIAQSVPPQPPKETK
jgi:hypothetical protein